MGWDKLTTLECLFMGAMLEDVRISKIKDFVCFLLQQQQKILTKSGHVHLSNLARELEKQHGFSVRKVAGGWSVLRLGCGSDLRMRRLGYKKARKQGLDSW